MNNRNQYGVSEQHAAEAARYPDLSLARVSSQYRDRYKIITEEGEYLAVISGRFRYEKDQMRQFPAVGDFVMVDRPEGNSGDAVIHRVLARKSAFERMAVGSGEQVQVVAANIDTVFVCMSLNHDYNLSRLERYLSVAWSSGAMPVTVLTKADLCNDLERVLAEVMRAAPGTDVIIVSNQDPESCKQLQPYVTEGKTVSLIGSSGVGKSTLINRLAGEELMSTSEIRSDGKGRHTTTRRELVILPQGGIVIDTPGMRELGVESVDLSQSFSDIEELAEACRFRDCSHTAEPGCAVRAALEEGRLDPRRMRSFQKLKREAQYDGLSSRQIENEKLDSMFEEVGGMKKARAFIRKSDKRRGGR